MGHKYIMRNTDKWLIMFFGVAIICVLALLYFVWTRGFQEGFQADKTVVPLDIYQTWHTKDLPPKMKECVDKLKQDNPEFTHHLYDDAMCRQFIKK